MEKKQEKKIRKDIRVLAGLTEIFCRKKHPEVEKHPLVPKGAMQQYASELSVRLCPECSRLVLHGAVMRIRCPMEPKPECKYCPNHCYHPKYRAQVREVMRFAWRYMLKRGRLDLVLKHM